jgi:hypothetical protein
MTSAAEAVGGIARRGKRRTYRDALHGQREAPRDRLDIDRRPARQ